MSPRSVREELSNGADLNLVGRVVELTGDLQRSTDQTRWGRLVRLDNDGCVEKRWEPILGNVPHKAEPNVFNGIVRTVPRYVAGLHGIGPTDRTCKSGLTVVAAPPDPKDSPLGL